MKKRRLDVKTFSTTCLKISFIFLLMVLMVASVSSDVFGASVAVTSPVSGDIWKGAEHNVTWTASGIQPYYEFYVYARKDGDPAQGYSIDISGLDYLARQTTWNTVGFADGQYLIRIMLWDHNSAIEVGEAFSSGLMKVDNTKPTSSVNVLASYQNTPSFTIDYTKNDATSGIDYVVLYYRKDSGEWISYGTFTDGITFNTATTGGDGNYQFYTRATDKAGNVEDAPVGADTSTIVDTVNPTASFTSFNPEGLTNGNSVTFVESCIDSGAGINSTNGCVVEVSFNEGAYTIVSSSPYSLAVNGDGNYSFRVTALDKAGNTHIATKQIIRDATAPVISITNAATSTWSVGGTVNVATTCSDNRGTCIGTKYYYSASSIANCAALNYTTDYVSSNVVANPYVCAAMMDDAGNIGYTASQSQFKTSPTIQGAITSASAGDIIEVAAGSYTEDLTINKALTLKGAGSSQVTINGLHTITASDVYFEGFTFAPVGSYGITINSAGGPISNIEISNSAFTLQGYSGVHIGGDAGTSNQITNVTMKNNVFNGPVSKAANPWKIGGYFGSPASTLVQDINFENNIVNKGTIPINLQNKNIDDILMNNNTFRDTDGAVYVWAQDGSTPTGILSNFVFTKNDIDSTNTYGVGFFDNDAGGGNASDTLGNANFGSGIIISQNVFDNIPGGYGLSGLSVLATGLTSNINATRNWWGNITGPQHTILNPDGKGSGVSDNVDFSPWSINLNHDVDEEKPTTTINSPIASTWFSANFQVNITDAEDGASGLKKCYYRVHSDNNNDSDFDDVGEMTRDWTERTCNSLLSITKGVGNDCPTEGLDVCRVWVKAVDNSGNDNWAAPYTTKTRTFSIDLTAPTTTDSGTDVNWHNSNVTVTLTPADAGSGVASTKYCTAATNDCTPTIDYAVPVEISTEGTIYFRYQSTDTAGNVESIKSATNTIKIDTLRPTTSDDYGLKDTLWQKLDQTIALTPADAGSGVASTKYCTDFTNTCDPSTGTAYTVPVINSTEGTTYFRYQSIDSAGNVQDVVSRTVKIDKSKPITSDDYEAKNNLWQQLNQTVTLTPADAGSGVASTKYCTSATNDCTPTIDYAVPVEISTEGTTYFRYQSIDSAGNIQDVVSRTVKIDKTGPSITHTQTATKRIVNEATEITATVIDQLNSVDSVTLYFNVDGVSGSNTTGTLIGNTYTATIPASTSKGNVTYYIEAKDNIGTKNTANTVTYTIAVNSLVLDLANSWNLVSVPKTLAVNSKSTLLSGNDVYKYNANTGDWETNSSTIDPGVGYWVNNASVLSVGLDYATDPVGPGGSGPSETINLYQGWNLIGHMCTNNQNVTVAFPSSIYNNLFVLRYDETSDAFQIYATQDTGSAQFTQMTPGEGYWVFLPSGNLAYTNIC